MPPFKVVKPATGAGRGWDSDPGVRDTVRGIVVDVRTRGDAAVREYSGRFDHWSPGFFRLSAAEIEEITSRVPAQALDDIDLAQQQVRNFAWRQRESLPDCEVETLPGVPLGQPNIPAAAAGPSSGSGPNSSSGPNSGSGSGAGS